GRDRPQGSRRDTPICNLSAPPVDPGPKGDTPVLTRRSVMLGMAGLLATSTALAACGDSPNDTSKNNPANKTTVLTVGMPNGPLTENENPFLTTSAGAKDGYRWVLYEPLMMWNPVKPADEMKPWLATKAEWNKDFTSVK